MDDQLVSGAVDRRRFLKRAGTIAWSAPIIYSLMTESALATHVPCGQTSSAGGGVFRCPTSTCPSTSPNCCSTSSASNNASCTCYSATQRTALSTTAQLSCTPV